MQNIIVAREMIMRVSIFIMLLIIQACDSSADTGIQNTEMQLTIKGHYISGHEVSSFQPCAQKKVFWVNASIKNLALLEQKYGSLTSKAYEPVFAELSGKFSGKASDGFASDYDGRLQLTEIIRMTKAFAGDCQ